MRSVKLVNEFIVFPGVIRTISTGRLKFMNGHIFCSTHPTWSVVMRSSTVQAAVDFMFIMLLVDNLTCSELMCSTFKPFRYKPFDL